MNVEDARMDESGNRGHSQNLRLKIYNLVLNKDVNRDQQNSKKGGD